MSRGFRIRCLQGGFWIPLEASYLGSVLQKSEIYKKSKFLRGIVMEEMNRRKLSRFQRLEVLQWQLGIF